LSKLLDSSHLVRLNPVRGDFLRLNVVKESGHHVSTARVGSHLECTVPVSVDDGVRSLATVAKVDLNIPMIQGLVPDKCQASVMVEYHRSVQRGPMDTVFPVELGVRSYQMDPASYDPDAKPSMIAFMSPIVHGAFCPDLTAANEEYAVVKRVEEVISDVEMTPFLLKSMNEFVELLIPTPHILHPVGFDDVYDQQKRPSQRVLLEHASVDTYWKRVVKMFLKREAYQDVKAPRPISTINCVDKLGYSEFIMAIAKLVGTQKWYAFSRTPRDVALRVTEVLNEAQFAVLTDFKKFDGHVSRVLRELEQLVLLRAFAVCYHARILDLHRSQFEIPAVTTFGVKYALGFSRASGSPETSTFNTVANAFINFLAIKFTKFSGAFLQASEAYSRLGLYGGDDGVTANVPINYFKHAARLVGQDVSSKLVSRGSLGVTFLSRQYSPEVWYGEPSSCADIARQVSKFHTTVGLPKEITPQMKLVAKCQSFACTDLDTPVIGKLVKTVLCLCEDDRILMDSLKKYDGELKVVKQWLSEIDLAVQYPNQDSGWMDAVVAALLPGFDMKRFDDWMSECKNLDDVLAAPLCLEVSEPKVPDPVVVDDQVVLPKSADKSPLEQNSQNRPTRQSKRSIGGKPRNEPKVKRSNAKPADGNWRADRARPDFASTKSSPDHRRKDEPRLEKKVYRARH
jgi:hypothetical protein